MMSKDYQISKPLLDRVINLIHGEFCAGDCQDECIELRELKRKAYLSREDEEREWTNGVMGDED